MPSQQFIQHLQKLLVHFKRHGGVHRPPGCTAIDLFDEEDITCWFVQLVYQDDEGIDVYVALRMLFAEDAEPERSASLSHPRRTFQRGSAAAEDLSAEDGAAAHRHSLPGRPPRRGLLIPRRMPLVFVISPRLTASFIHHGAICSQELMSQQWEQTPENMELLIAALHTTLHPFCKDSCVSASAVDPSSRMAGGGGALRSGTVATLPLASSYSASEHHDGIRLIQLAHPYQFRTFVAPDEIAATTEDNDGSPTATRTAVPAMRHGSGEEAGTFVCSASPPAPRCSPALMHDEDRLSGLPDDGHTIRHVQDLQAVLHHTSTTARTAIFSTVGILADVEATHRPLAPLPSDVSPPHASSAQRTLSPPADSDGVRIVQARTSPDGRPQVIVTLTLPHRPPIATGTHTTHIRGDLPLLRTSSSPQQLLHGATGALHAIENTASQLHGGDAEQLGFLLAPPVPPPPSSPPQASGGASSCVVRTDIPSWCALHLSDMYIYGHLRVFGKITLERCVFIGSIAAEERGSVTMRTSLMGVAIENTLWCGVSNTGMSANRTDFSPTANQAARDDDDWPPRQQEGILALDSAVIGISGGSVVTRIPPLPTAAACSPSDEPITTTPVTAGGRRVTEQSLSPRLLANRDVHHHDGGLPPSRVTAPPLRALILVSNTAKLAIVGSRIDPGKGCERTIFAEQSAMVDILHSVLIAGNNCALSVQGCDAYCDGVLTVGVSDVGGSPYGSRGRHARKRLRVSDTDRVNGFNVEFGGTLTARNCTVDAVYFGFSVLAHSVAHLYRCHVMRVVNGYTIDASTASLENCTGRAHHVGVFAVHQAKVVFTHDGDKDYDERCRAVASCWQESLRLEQQDAGGGGTDNCQKAVKTPQLQRQSPLLHEFQGISSPSRGDHSSHHTVEEVRVPATPLSHDSESRLARSASALPFAVASDSHLDTRKPCAGRVPQASDGYHGRENVRGRGSCQQLDDNESDDGEAEDHFHDGNSFARRVARLTRRAQSIYKRTVLAGSSDGPQHQPPHPPDSARHTVAAGCCGCLEGGRYNLEARNAWVRAVGITFLSPWDACVSAYEGSQLELADCVLWSHRIPLLDARNHSTNASPEAQRTPTNDDKSQDGSTNRMQEHTVGKVWCGSGGGSANVLTNGVKLITSVADITRCLCINLYFSYALLHHSVASFSECYAVGGVNGFTVDRSRATLVHCGTDTRQVGVYALRGATIELCGTEHRVGSGERTETSPQPPLRIAGGYMAVYMGGKYGIEVHGSTATGRGVTVRRGRDSCINVYGGSTVHLSRSLVDASAEDAAHSLVCRSGATSALHRRPHGSSGLSRFPSEPDVESPASTNSLPTEAKRDTAHSAALWCSPHGVVAPGSTRDVGPGPRPTVGIKVWSASSCHVSDSEVRCVMFGMAAIGPLTSLEAHHCIAKHVVNGYTVEAAHMLLAKCSANSSGVAILALSQGQCIIHRGSYTSRNCGLESRGATVQIRGAVKLYGFAVAGVWIHDGAHMETEVDGRLDVQATKPISSRGRAPYHAPPHHHTRGGISRLHQGMLLPFTPTGAVCLLVERAAAIIHQSNFGGGASCGLSCGNGGRVHLYRSAFCECAHVGVRVLDGGQVFLTDCTVAGAGRYALLVEEGGRLHYADNATTTPTTRSPSPRVSALEDGTAAASVRPSGKAVSASSGFWQLRGLAQRLTSFLPLRGRREPGPPCATPVRGTAGTATADAPLRHGRRSTAHSRQSGGAPSEEDESIMNRLLRKVDRLRRHGRTAALTGAVMVRGGVCSIQGVTLCPSTSAEEATCAMTTVSRLSPSGLPAAPRPTATAPTGSVGCHGTSHGQGSTARLAADVSRPVKASTTTPAHGGGRGDPHGTHTAELTNDACLTVRTGGMLIVKQCIIELPPVLVHELHQQQKHWVDVPVCAFEGDADRSVGVCDTNNRPVTIFRSAGVGAVLRVAHTFLVPPGTLDTAADRTASRLLDEALAQTLQPGSPTLNATSDGERGAAGGCSWSAANTDTEPPSSSLGDGTDDPARCQLVEVVDRAEASLHLVSSASALPPHAPPSTAMSAGTEGGGRPALSSAPWLPGIRVWSDEDSKMLTTVPQGWRSMPVSIRVHDAANCRLDTCNVHRLVIAGGGSRVEVRRCLLTGPTPLLCISHGASVQIAESVLLGVCGAPMTGSVDPDVDVVPQSREAALLLAHDANVSLAEVSVVVVGRRPVLRLGGCARLTAPGMQLSVRRVAPPLTGAYHDSASVSAAAREGRAPPEAATDAGDVTLADGHASPAAGSTPAGCLDHSLPVVLTDNDAEVRTAQGGVDPSKGWASEGQRGRAPSRTPHQALIIGALCGLVAAAAFAARLGRRTVRS